MRLWIDNTGLHSVTLCLAGQARPSVDFRGLLQFATFAVFSDQILVNGFEHDQVARTTMETRDALNNIGFGDLHIQPETEDSYALACQFAAEDAANNLPFVFQPVRRRVAGLGPVRLSSKVIGFDTSIAKLVNLKARALDDLKDEVLSNKAAGAVQYMFAISPPLRKAVRGFVRLKGPLSETQAEQLAGLLRYYLNDALAVQNFARYAPAVKRAELLRRQSRDVISDLERALDDVIVAQLKAKPLGVPPVAAALVQKSKGDPRGLLEEAAKLRNKTQLLRRWLNRRLRNADFGTPEGQFRAQEAVKEVIDLLMVELYPGKRPKLRDAIEIIFVCGVPTLRISPRKFFDSAESLWNRRKVTVLSEISKAAAFPTDPYALRKLEKNCSRKLKQ